MQYCQLLSEKRRCFRERKYKGMIFSYQHLKIAARVIKKRTGQQVNIKKVQFGVTPGLGTTDGIFNLPQLQEH